MKSAGLCFELSEAQLAHRSEKLSGFTFVVSGVFSRSRDEIKSLIEQHGGKNTSSVSAKTSYLVAGENMGPEKLKKRRSWQLKLLTRMNCFC